MSSSAIKKVLTIKTVDILEAYNAHGADFVIIDIDSIRDSKFSQYIDPIYKLANGDLIKPSKWIMKSPEGIQISSRIRNPAERRYELIRFGVNQIDENGNENDNMRALKYVCESLELKLNELIDNKLITEDKKRCKVVDGKTRPVYFMSTKIDTPIQKERLNKDTNEYEQLEHNYYWINLQKKRYWGTEKAPTPVQFEDAYYLDDGGNPDDERPVMIHEYNTKFFNIEKGFFNKNTGKKMYKLVGDYDSETKQTTLNNTNIQNYLTNGTLLLGDLQVQIAISRTKCKVDVALGREAYIKTKPIEFESGMDFDGLDDFAKAVTTSTNVDAEDDEDEEKAAAIDEPDEEDF